MKRANNLLIQSIPRGWVLALAVAGSLLATIVASQAQTQVYSEDFESNSGNFVTNTIGGVNFADTFFDYSTVGIPSAPHSTGGTTHGLKLAANLVTAVQAFPSGISVSPLNFSITENFEMHCDMWMNFNGPCPGGGSGTTQFGGAGYGTAGTKAQAAGGTFDSVIVGATVDGGSTADYRMYAPNVSASYQDADHIIRTDTNTALVYFCGSRAENGGGNYYVTNFPSSTVPAAQLALYPQQTNSIAPFGPGTNKPGTLAFGWHDVAIKKVATVITYTVDKHLIATADTTDAGNLGGGNLVFSHFDSNSGASTDPNRTNLCFTLFDNVRVTNFPSVVTVSATTATASETGPTSGTFTITRSEPGPAVTIYYTMSGTASNGSDYVTLPGSASLAVNETSTTVTLTPIDDSISEYPETAILTISEGTNYIGAGSATITIADNDTPTIDISTVQGSMYERLPTDYVRFRLTRYGNLDAADFPVNLSYSGTAATSRHTATTGVTMPMGATTVDFDVNPVNDALLQGDQTIICTVATGSDYTVGTTSPSATATIVDDELPAETVLFSDNFNTDSSANWTLRYASTNAADNDYLATFAYDYSTYSWGAIPAAPHSGSDTHGLFVQVNKADLTPAAAALNLYPKNKSFSGNFALRFDMYLIAPGSGTTEYALFGINHSGNQTNWFRNSTNSFAGVDPTGWTFDGLFYGVETDAAALGDYALYSAPTTTGRNPTPLNSRSASTLTGILKSTCYAFAGAPSQTSSPTNLNWADVEISQVGNLVTLKINQTVIFSYTNTTAFTSGNIMLGNCDAYDSVGENDGGVIYDNVRVVQLAASLAAAKITSIVPVGAPATSYTISYNSGSGTQFVLLTSPTVNAPLSGWTRAQTNSTGSGTFSVSAGTQGFYRIKSE